MIFDLRKLGDGEELRGDVCVVGSGAAGVSLALELSRNGVSVVLVEAGGSKWNKHDQDLYKGEVTDLTCHSELDAYRHRRLGGTTTVWGGRCVPFDEVDFQKREHVPYSGWPITLDDLLPYYKKSHPYLHIGQYSYKVSETFPDRQQSMVPGLPGDMVQTNSLERFSLPTDFGKHHRGEIRSSANIRLFLHANCTEIETTGDGGQVTGIHVRTLEGKAHFVRAKTYVLCAGGLEVTRMLLASNKTHHAGIGNHSDKLGRFYMSHISGTIAELAFSVGPLVWDHERDDDGVYCRRRFTISEQAQRDHRLLNFAAFLHHPPIQNAEHGDGLLSAIYLAKNIRYMVHHIPPEYSNSMSIKRHLTTDLGAHLYNIARDSPKIMAKAPSLFYKRFLEKRRLPSIIVYNPQGKYTLYYHVEQSPCRDSVVQLASSRDALGMPRLQVNYMYNDMDIESIYRSHELIGEAVSRHKCGQLRFLLDDPRTGIRDQVSVGGHNIGTTRMAQTAVEGVVDKHCRVFGVGNLFVGSSSVFPTSSQANPMLTIVAIALRIADRIRTVLPQLAA